VADPDARRDLEEAAAPLIAEIMAHPCVVTCCLCLSERASVFGGHVTRGSERLCAGWCRACRDRLDASACPLLRNVARTWTIAEFMACDLVGWCGHWLDAMGRQTCADAEAYWLAKRAETQGEAHGG